MGSIGFDELLIVGIVAIIAFGKDLPKVARRVGRWYAKLMRHLSEMKEEIARQIPDEEDWKIPEGRSDPDPGHGPSPSAGLPGPDPSDPEYRGGSKTGIPGLTASGTPDPTRSSQGNGRQGDAPERTEDRPPARSDAP